MIGLVTGDAGPIIEDILLEGSGALLSLSFSRGQETESDNFAVDLMHEIGRDPEAMALFFERIENYDFFAKDDTRPFCEDETEETQSEGVSLEAGNNDDPLEATDLEEKDCQVKIESDPEGEVEAQASVDEPKINMEWMSTHPLSQKRIDNIRARAAKLRGE